MMMPLLVQRSATDGQWNGPMEKACEDVYYKIKLTNNLIVTTMKLKRISDLFRPWMENRQKKRKQQQREKKKK